MLGPYLEWRAAQRQADELRDALFGTRVRDNNGREGHIFRVSTQGIFVYYDGATAEEKCPPESLKALRVSALKIDAE